MNGCELLYATLNHSTAEVESSALKSGQSAKAGRMQYPEAECSQKEAQVVVALLAEFLEETYCRHHPKVVGSFITKSLKKG